MGAKIRQTANKFVLYKEKFVLYGKKLELYFYLWMKMRNFAV